MAFGTHWVFDILVFWTDSIHGALYLKFQKIQNYTALFASTSHTQSVLYEDTCDGPVVAHSRHTTSSLEIITLQLCENKVVSCPFNFLKSYTNIILKLLYTCTNRIGIVLRIFRHRNDLRIVPF